MTAIELVGLITSSGVLAGGLGILRWSLIVERRLMHLELLAEVEKPARRAGDRNRRHDDPR